ncbi:hypothetical protein UA08_04343 [Talaromyces atroroseus]|uniref:Uncharacterized protein n=1 Tax=Talaromyces atroroseus TaxID=1441469 RepID=A0A1Q5Q9B1_TALAT|nr:hypothetical protein UA08_04343 [Talaromyces atroroseus]OKL60540.1 hypothetical protein UA08_04343 [Talaromyces atroroseus]
MFTKAIGIFAALSAAASALPTSHNGRRHAHGHQVVPRDTTVTSDGVEITNNMDQTIYLWSVSDVSSEMYTINSGESYSENWRTNPNGGGISIKMSFTPEETDVLQYEYTYDDPIIWWDLSCINMGDNSGFSTVGFAVTSDDADCPSAICAPGDYACAAAYLFPDDNTATHACTSSNLLHLNLGSSNVTITA